MNTSVNLLALPIQLLFDGLSDGFYEYVFHNDTYCVKTISVDDIYDNYFHLLLPLIGEESFNQILTQGHFMEYSDKYSFKGSDKLSLRYFICDKSAKILIFALGEFQPDRYKIYLDGVWNVENYATH